MLSRRPHKLSRSCRTRNGNATVSGSSELPVFPRYNVIDFVAHRLQATEVNIAQFQAEIGALEIAHLQVDDHKKKSDAKSK